MGTTRIATQVGDDYIRTRAQQAGEDVQKLQNLQKADLADILRQSKNFKKVTYNKREPVAFADDEEKDTDTLRRQSGNVYFYHPDHLGTATLLTDFSGAPYQFFLNLPFGEDMASQHSTTADFSSRYKFNAKELDKETGWYYYGARYYDPQVSTWLSVDPLAEKYIGFSPYNFTLGNPVRLVDVDGKKNEDWVYNKKKKKYEWHGNVTSPSEIKDKKTYEYVGKSRNSVNNHFKKIHPFLHYIFNPDIDMKSFKKYLSKEIMRRVDNFAKTGKKFRIDNIRGLKENIDLKHSINKGRFKLPLYNNSDNTIGKIEVKLFPNEDSNIYGPNTMQVINQESLGTQKYPYQIYIYNFDFYHNFENPQAGISLFFDKNEGENLYGNLIDQGIKSGAIPSFGGD